jgi:hypothetical protein
MVPSPDVPGKYLLATGRDRRPLTYTLQAVKSRADAGSTARAAYGSRRGTSSAAEPLDSAPVSDR